MRTGSSAGAEFLLPVLLVAAVLLLFLTGAPTGDAFSWPDAPRHALNGAFVMDFLRDMPLHDPVGYAYSYYAKYPALTILFYPPLFYFFLAPFYAVFGVSQTSALMAEFVCYAALATGTYRLARFWLEPLPAFGAALVLVSAPEVAYWGRQVMLEIPSFALLTWSAVFFMRHLRENRIGPLYAALALAVLAMYTKMTVAFVFPVYLIVLWQRRGAMLFRDKHTYFIAGIAFISLMPLAVMTAKFGQANVQSLTGIPDEQASRSSIAGWIWYARQFPSQMSWAVLVAGVAGMLAVLRKRSGVAGYGLLFAWFCTGYIFFSAIALKESRHSVLLLLPFAIFAAVGIQSLLGRWPNVAAAAVVVLGFGTLAWTIFERPVQYVAGYDRVAAYIATVAPKDSAIAFSGYRDGSFIFAMRTHTERRDLSFLRVDKLLLRVSVRRSLGVQQKPVAEDDIAPTLDRLSVAYVVAQPGFWTDLDVMRRFENVLHGVHFQPVRRFEMPANYHAQEKELIIYRNLGHVAHGPVKLNIDLPMIGRTIPGTIAHE